MFFDSFCSIIIRMEPDLSTISAYRQSGNVMWFVLLAVALLAALSITISRSTDTIEQNADLERARVMASEILRYTKNIEESIKQMSMRGISESDLCFDAPEWDHADYNYADCATPENRIFDAAGAGISFKNFVQASNWVFFGSHEVDGVGDADRNELMVQAEIRSAYVCEQINRLVGVTNPDGPPVEDVYAPVLFIGDYGDAATGSGDNILGDDTSELSGKKAGCRADTDSPTNYYFYHVLIER